MDTMGQTKKRVEISDEVNSTKKRRKSTGDKIAQSLGNSLLCFLFHFCASCC